MSIEFKVLNELNDKLTIVIFIKNVNIINNLKVKMFLSNNIIDSKNIIFNVNKNTTIINNCQNFITLLIVTNYNSLIKRLVKIINNFKILINFIITIFYKLRNKIILLINKNFIFISQRLKLLKFKSDIFLYIIDVYIKIIIQK